MGLQNLVIEVDEPVMTLVCFLVHALVRTGDDIPTTWRK